MIYLLVSDDSLFHRMVSETFLQDEEVFSWAGRKKNGEAWPGPGAPFYGDTSEAETFRTVAPGKAVVALVCMKDAARTADAVDALSTGISSQTNYWAAYYYRGLAYHALGKTEEAKSDFLKVAELSQEMGILGEYVEKLKEFGVSAKLYVEPKKP